MITTIVLIVGFTLFWAGIRPRRRKYDKIDNDRLRSMTQVEINRYTKRR